MGRSLGNSAKRGLASEENGTSDMIIRRKKGKRIEEKEECGQISEEKECRKEHPAAELRRLGKIQKTK